MNKMIFCLILTAFMAFGQRAEKLDRAAATRAWDMAVSLPSDTPQVSGGGLVVENETNGIGRKAWLVTTQPGTYLLRGRNCSGEETKLGELGLSDRAISYSVQILDTVGLQMAAPFFPQFCTVDVLRINEGRIEGSSAGVNPWVGEPSHLKVGGEGVTQDGQYYVAIGLVPADSVAILGRGSVATEIRNSPMGTSIVIFPPLGLPPFGPTTLTVCTKGICSSVVFERKMASTGPSEKG